MSSEAAPAQLEDQLYVETSLLRTLCLTINSDTSEVKYKILDELSKDNFYFPITKAIFGSVVELHEQGAYVVAQHLEESISRQSVALPDNFFLDDLFLGEVPPTEDVHRWMDRLLNPGKASEPAPPQPPPTSPSIPDAAEVAEASPPPPTPPAASALDSEDSELPTMERPAVSQKAPPPPPPDAESAPTEADSEQPDASLETESSDAPEPAAKPTAKPPPPPPPASPSPSAETKAPAKRRRASKSASAKAASQPATTSGKAAKTGDLPAPEGAEWLGYLENISAKQGRRLPTGFTSLDEATGGLPSGLMLLTDDDQERGRDFLKQLADQIASQSVPCLYLAFDANKELLRLRTLARLAGVPSSDMEGGRFEPDSSQWEKVMKAGQKAVDWMKRIYVVEAKADLSLSRVRDMTKQLLKSGDARTCLLAIDSFEKFGGQTDPIQTFAELKELAESLGISVIAVAQDVGLVSMANADATARFSGSPPKATLEVTNGSDASTVTLNFQYRAELHRFAEVV